MAKVQVVILYGGASVEHEVSCRSAKYIFENLDRKNAWKEADDTKNNEIKIVAKREKDVAGTHTVKYFSNEDILELKHSAKSRQGFALGAVLAAEWVQNKKGFFEMKDMLDF